MLHDEALHPIHSQSWCKCSYYQTVKISTCRIQIPCRPWWITLEHNSGVENKIMLGLYRAMKSILLL